MALSFVGQDLRNRSFRGRKDLAGADFTNADIRGCDFRDADLTGTNFTNVTTGKSYKQVIVLIGISAAFILVFGTTFLAISRFIFITPVGILLAVLIGILMVIYATSDGFTSSFSIISVSLAFKVAFIFARKFALIATSPILIIAVFEHAKYAYSAFIGGNTFLILINTIITLICISLTLYIWRGLDTMIQSATGIDFARADLTGAKFVNAKLQVSDFTDAICDLVNWEGTEFKLCKLPAIIEDSKVRYLCCNPKEGRGKNYTLTNFHKVFLQNADLVDAILRNANFNGADLRGAKITNADLSNSQALGTDFSGATLTGARIFNWGINPETKFENVICTHVYIDEAGKERKPASGDFAEGDFALLVGEFTNTLDFLFKNEINFSAFQYAMQQMAIKNPEVELSINQTKFLGQNKDALKRSYDVSPDADKGKLHADFSESYDIYKRLHPEDNQLIRDLNRKVTFLEGEVKTLKVLNAEKDERIADLKDANAGFKEIAKTQATKSNDKIIIGQVQGDPMSDKNQNISLKSDGNMTGITVAGGDISGTVTVTIQQLRDSDTPEAPKLADLLTDLQKVINESTELTEEDKAKALQYIDTIGKFANNKEDHDMIGTVIDKIIKVVSKAAKLLTPVQAIADGLRKILQL
ncbi:pentapeptide repeat-containing protein [Pseudanabaena sp. Chao 1811]|uniref:pentapeptide repeat-containing protein n=1 Tax=Pseudanabaena sp. Chao 1811 TaxID=2963092 RepID=UPI0022F3E22A|nr:pentapeptide repeat-containing protein [Pseudanabaena sp. Chao 1811]